MVLPILVELVENAEENVLHMLSPKPPWAVRVGRLVEMFHDLKLERIIIIDEWLWSSKLPGLWLQNLKPLRVAEIDTTVTADAATYGNGNGSPSGLCKCNRIYMDVGWCGQQHWSSSSQVLRAVWPAIQQCARTRPAWGRDWAVCLGYGTQSAIATTSAEIGGSISKKRLAGSHLPVCCFCWGKGNEVWDAWWCGIRHCIKSKFNVVESAKGLCQTTMQSSCASHCYEIALDETFDKWPRQSLCATYLVLCTDVAFDVKPLAAGRSTGCNWSLWRIFTIGALRARQRRISSAKAAGSGSRNGETACSGSMSSHEVTTPGSKKGANTSKCHGSHDWSRQASFQFHEKWPFRKAT